MATLGNLSFQNPQHRSVWARYVAVAEPLPPRSPSVFTEQERRLHEEYCVERPGPWDSTTFPYQKQVMDGAEEAVRLGKNFVFMKGGQIGGTDCMINVMLWLKVYFPGPQLFMTSIEKVANEFGRERFAKIIPDMPSLRRTFVPNKRGGILTKRFTDGKIQLAGGKSINNLQSTPYRVVVIDELDSLTENLGGQGDPLKLAEIRTDSFSGPTMLIAYAHPSTRDRGAAKLFYDNSDQRRGFVRHAACGKSFWLSWEHVKCTSEDATDPDAYCYACPECGQVIEDGERVAMVRNVEYRSVLPPEQAKKKTWIGFHASQLYSPAKTLRSFAERWIACGDDENAKRVFYNKILGEPYELKVKQIDAAALRGLIVVKRRPNDLDFYSRGEVPAGVSFLTAGQDSRSTQLHFSVWGWGMRKCVDGTRALCGWLIDWAEIERKYSLEFKESEYHVFDSLIYDRVFPGTDGKQQFQVMQCGHDVGYAPTQIPITRYCRSWPQRAIPVKGASLTATSASKAAFASWGSARKHKAGETEVIDDSSRHMMMNTFMLKTALAGMLDPEKKIEVMEFANEVPIGVRKIPLVQLPEDVDEEWMKQSAAEAIVKGKKNNELVWQKTGPNHFNDCNTYAYGLALNIDPFQRNRTADELRRKRRHRSMGGGSSGFSGDAAMG